MLELMNSPAKRTNYDVGISTWRLFRSKPDGRPKGTSPQL